MRKRGEPADAWIASAYQPRLSLEPTDGQWPHGWVLFQSRVVRETTDYTARLYLDVGEGPVNERSLVIPVTRKGTINELIFLPNGLVRLDWSPIGTAGSFEQAPIHMTEVGTVERMYRMVWRVYSMYKKLSPDERTISGLSYSRMVVDLQGAYSAVGVLRSYMRASHTGGLLECRRENGIVTARIHADIVIAVLEQAAAALFVQNGAVSHGASSELSLVRRYLFPHLIEQVRQNYDVGSISVRLQQSVPPSEGNA
ncbi:MAG: hypothetical protein L0H94_03900 [Nitrospira sp.]|nr:hypothetical protein [Nitrospira sp.]